MTCPCSSARDRRSKMFSSCETSRGTSLLIIITLALFLQATGNVLCNQSIFTSVVKAEKKVKVNSRADRVHYYYAEEARYQRIASAVSARLLFINLIGNFIPGSPYIIPS